MSTYNIHAGHGITGGTGCGAVGILDESLEARKVKDALINYLKMEHTVYDCTYNGSASASAILESIVAMCNTHYVDLDISIHLNSGRSDYNGDDSTGGVEVLGYDNETKEIGEAICINIANALGIRNRGFKINQSLYVLRKTKSPALLIDFPSLILITVFMTGLILVSGKRDKTAIFELIDKSVMSVGIFVCLFTAIVILSRLDDPSAIGPHLAVCILSLFYAIILKLVAIAYLAAKN